VMLCPECFGAGALGVDADEHPNLCDTCDGHGYVRAERMK
jgi:DnaJ-class molecular chaperone